MTGATKQTKAPSPALAIRRYHRTKPQNAYATLAREWPHPPSARVIMNLVDDLRTTWTSARAARQHQPYDPAREDRWARQRQRDEQERQSRWGRQKQWDEDLALLYPGINTRPKYSSITLAPN